MPLDARLVRRSTTRREPSASTRSFELVTEPDLQIAGWLLRQKSLGARQRQVHEAAQFGRGSWMYSQVPATGGVDLMASHTVGTREEWLAARLELLEAEKELTRRSDELGATAA
jgi:hypothetical protein